MKITYEKTQYFTFAFEYTYSTSIMEYCRFIKQTYGWKEFNFNQGKWRFNTPTIISLIQMQFPGVVITDEVKKMIKEEEERQKESIAIREKAKEIRLKEDSDISIPGIKGDLYPYQKIGVEFFTNSKGRAILADTMGCLSGDTEIIINRGGNARKYKIKDAFLRFNGLDRRKNKNWKIPSFTRSLNDKKEFELNQIDKILYKGQKSVLEIVVKNIKTGLEKKIRLTPDHEIMSESSGWIESCKLKIGDRVLTNGTNKKFCSVCKKETEHVSYRYSKFFGECKKCIYSFLRNNYGKKKKNSLGDGRHFDKNGYILVSGMKNHPSVLKSKRKTGTNYYVQEHVLAMEAKINKYSLPRWIKRIRFNKVKKTDRFIDIKKYSVHHKDGVKQNNSLSNLELLKKSEHARLEGKNRLYRNLGECFLPSVSEVVAVSPRGIEDVYDIVMKDPYRNFIANGIVVHNCGKTAQTLGYLLAAGHKRTLVVCPASVKYSWEGEVKKWTDLEPFVVTSQTDFFDIPPSANVIIINYDVLKKHFKALMAKHWDCCVADECVIPQTYIATKEGQKQVEELSSGEMVLTYNTKSKKYEYKPLLRVIKKPLVRKLKKVGDLICTEDHPIFDGNEYVEARDAKKTFPIGLPELRLGTSDEVLAGCLMGDASLKREKVKEGKANNNGVRLVIGNCIKNEDYIKMKCDALDMLDISRLKIIQNGGYKPGPYFRATSLIDARLVSFYEDTYRDGKRLISEKILNMMGEAGLAVWIQDDGSCGSRMIRLNTQRYGLEGNRNLKEWFEKKYNVYPVVCPERKRDGRIFYFLSFCVRDSLKIYSLIRDFIVPSMRYKFVSLEERFNKIYTNICRACGRRIFGLHKARQNIVKNICFCEECKRNGSMKRFQRKKIAEPKKYDYVYDLEVEDNHNFFADGILVHNCQMIKSPTAIRTKAVKILTREIKHVIMLSGTPLLSRPIELFTMLNIIDPLTWKNYYEYATRYCAGHRGKWGFEAKGATNLAELTERISRYFLRRTKDQVLKNLPPKNKMILPVDLSGDSLKDYKKASKEFMKFLKENKKKKAKEIAKTMQAERLTKINYLREIAVMGRLDAAKELIDSIIDAGEKVLVFSSFNAPLEELYDHYFDKAIMITGKTDVEERGDIVKRFQSDPSVQVFLGGFLSAGTGITLTAAQNVVLLDYPWRPGDTEQAIDRCHRPGTTASSINIYQMHSRGTIDDFMKKTLERKQAIFDVVVDSQKVGPKDEDMVDELIKLLEEDEL